MVGFPLSCSSQGMNPWNKIYPMSLKWPNIPEEGVECRDDLEKSGMEAQRAKDLDWQLEVGGCLPVCL